MDIIHASNVCAALPEGLKLLLQNGVREESRAGPVIVMPHPVVTVYEQPRERVLASPVRDANPFFHVAESLWMLAGRDDVKFLDLFIKDFGARFAEPGGEVHGAYGHRWRTALGFDQLDHVIGVLKKDPTSRQCVIQMWDAVDYGVGSSRIPMPGDTEEDLEDRVGSNDLRGSWRDRPCNTHVYLRVRESIDVAVSGDLEEARRERRTPTMVLNSHVLDITVLCRSNDIIMGAYGANAVHFSILQEYLAAMIGVGVGRYYQVSNNFHAYQRDIDRLTTRTQKELDLSVVTINHLLGCLSSPDWHPPIIPLVNDPSTFDEELKMVLGQFEHLDVTEPGRVLWAGPALNNGFLTEVAWSMMVAYQLHRNALGITAETLLATVQKECDWTLEGLAWLRRHRR